MKGQAALEFLMTYGWAILIVIAVVAALYAMGVFKLPGAGVSGCSPCFPAGSDVAYVSHNAGTLLLRVGPNTVRYVQTTGNNYTTGQTFSIDISGECGAWSTGSCTPTTSIAYDVIVDGSVLPKTVSSVTLHKTW